MEIKSALKNWALEIKNKNQYKYALILVCCFAYLGIAFITQILGKGNRVEPETPTQSIPSHSRVHSQIKAGEDLTQKRIIRIERKLPGQNETENVIFADNEMIARFKNRDGKIYDGEGQVPDGKIKFTNELEKTYGYENYQDGQRTGEYAEYYQNNQIRSQAQYRQNKILKQKDYFMNGSLRMEADYTSAPILAMRGLAEVGTGKIYRADGSLKYEWAIVDNPGETEKNFNKTYDNRGEMIMANYYNNRGELLEHWEKPPISP